jgi:hypothetical protein
MPKEHKKRGRRDEEKKRKRGVDESDAGSKRLKKEEDEVEEQVESIEYGEGFQDEAVDVTRPGALTYYGMLDDDEQEYFKRADEMLELNQFEDAEARKLFLDSVYKEADGKELKIANSQSCSRLLERLILLSSPDQLKSLFQKFSGQYVHPTHLPFPLANESQLPQSRPAPVRLPLLRSTFHTCSPRRHPRARRTTSPAHATLFRPRYCRRVHGELVHLHFD